MKPRGLSVALAVTIFAGLLLTGLFAAAAHVGQQIAATIGGER